VHQPTLRRPQALTRAEYATRAQQLYQPTPAPFAANALFLILCGFNMLVIYEDIGPPTLAARVGLLAVVNGVLLGGAFLVAQEVARRRAGRLGLLCPSCGRYPLGISRLRYTMKARVERVLMRGCCEHCGNDLFHDAAS
jgi:hypothetical protein